MSKKSVEELSKMLKFTLERMKEKVCIVYCLCIMYQLKVDVDKLNAVKVVVS